MNSKVVIIASGITSPLFSMIAYAQRMRADGWSVSFLAPEPSRNFIEAAGFDLTLIPEPKLSVLSALVPRGASGDTRAQALAALGVDDLEETLRALAPDLIIVDCEMHAHLIVALSTDVPVIQAHNMFLSPPGLQAPPLHMRAVPGRGLRGSRLGVAMLWAWYLLRKHSKLLRRRIKQRGADQPSALHALARSKGVKIEKLKQRLAWQLPWTYRVPTILFLPKALDLPTPHNPQLTYVGPMIWKDRPAQDYDKSIIDAFRNAPKGTRVYVAFGSGMTPEGGLLDRIWDVAARNPEWHMLCVVGGHWTATPNRTKPENVRVIPWAPQATLLHDTDLFVFHGGTSSLVEAVDAATPMLVYPHVLDQEGSAARVVFHGLGRSGDPKDRAAKIEADMRAVLGDPDIELACQKMQIACRAERDAHVAEEVSRAQLSSGARS